MREFTCMGDPHLGRRFKTGVPLHRLGDRESLVWEQFERELNNAVETKFHVNLGDLFDKFVVPPEVVLRAALVYREAAQDHPDTTFVVLRGNHDVSRDTTKASSFEIFAQLVGNIPNIVVVDQHPLVIDGYGFVPYDAFIPAVDQIGRLPDGLKRVFTHFDFQDWGGDHVLPTAQLAEKRIFHVTNGHDHLKRMEERHGVAVEIFGSMQPFSHAEDRTGDWYVTLRLDELDGQCVRDKNVRLLLKDGEEAPTDLDCLSLQVRRLDSEESSLEVDTSDFDAFDLRTALSEAVNETVREDIMRIFDDAQAPAT